MLNTNKYLLSFNRKRKHVKMTFTGQFQIRMKCPASKCLVSVLSWFVTGCASHWSPDQAVKPSTKNLVLAWLNLG